MAKDLKKNLKVFSIDTRPMTFPVMEPTLANQMIYKQRASATASRHSECGYRISLAQKLETPEDKLRFAKKLFSEANLEYLGIFGTYFLFRKDVVRRFPGSRPFRLAWLKQLTFEKRDASELYKALFHSDHT